MNEADTRAELIDPKIKDAGGELLKAVWSEENLKLQMVKLSLAAFALELSEPITY